jgi:hypothetical protein
MRKLQVVVQKEMAMTLRFPYRVTSFNKKMLKEAIINGPEVYPGANRIVKVATGFHIGLKYGQHLDNNDTVLFKRLPSLHRISIMGFRAKIMPSRTLRFNVRRAIRSTDRARKEISRFELRDRETGARASEFAFVESNNYILTERLRAQHQNMLNESIYSQEGEAAREFERITGTAHDAGIHDSETVIEFLVRITTEGERLLTANSAIEEENAQLR